MLRDKFMKYSYGDVMVVPEVVSTISSRKECNPFVDTKANGYHSELSDGTYLPIFTAPMPNVVDDKCADIYDICHIIPILPRNDDKQLEFLKRGSWVALSLSEFTDYFGINSQKSTELFNDGATYYVVIDVANGHMQNMLTIIKEAKTRFGSKLIVMAGNVANPKTYRHYYNAGVDYIRCGIGSGFCCITSTNVGVHYPLASLIDDIANEKRKLIKRGIPQDKLPKIVADGGIRNYSDVIKALALGADFVMVGSLFAKCLESASTKYHRHSGHKEYINRMDLAINSIERLGDRAWEIKDLSYKITKKSRIVDCIFASYYGMASIHGQADLGKTQLSTPEGVEKEVVVEFKLDDWVHQMIDYLRSAMSYTNSRTIDELKDSDVVLISNNTKNSIN